MSVGTGSTANNQNFCADNSCVDGNGVPTIVSGSQTVNNSTNSGVSTSCQVDLSVTKTADNTTLRKGDTVVFTITLKNDGNAVATGVTVKDILPVGLTYVAGSSVIPASTTYNSGTGIWDLSSLNIESGDMVELKIAATINEVKVLKVNEVEIITQNQTDSDSVPNNGN